MKEFIPYILGAMVIIFGVIFYFGLQKFRYKDPRHEERRLENEGVIEEPHEKE